MANLGRGKSRRRRGAEAGSRGLVDEIMGTHESDRILAIFSHMYLQIKWLLTLRRLAGDENGARYYQATDDVAESPSLHLIPRLVPHSAGLGCLCLLPTYTGYGGGPTVAIGRDSQSAGTNVRSGKMYRCAKRKEMLPRSYRRSYLLSNLFSVV